MNTKTAKKCLFGVVLATLLVTGMSTEVQASAYTPDRKTNVLEVVSSVVPGLPEWDLANRTSCVRLKSLGLGNIFLHNIRYASVDRENLSAVIDGREMRQSKMLDSKLREQLWKGLHEILPKCPLKNLIVINEPTCLDFSLLSCIQGMYLINTEFPGETFAEFTKNLKGNTTLKSLYFERDAITDITVSFLASSLANNDSLKYLCFRDCSLTNQVFIAYSLDNILMNTSITHMSVSGSIGDAEAIRIITAAVLRRCLEGRPLELFDAGAVGSDAAEYLRILKEIVPTGVHFHSSGTKDARSAKEIIDRAIELKFLTEESREEAEARIVLKKAQENFAQADAVLRQTRQNQSKLSAQLTTIEGSVRHLREQQKTLSEQEKANIRSLQQRVFYNQMKVKVAFEEVNKLVLENERQFQQAEYELRMAKAAYDNALEEGRVAEKTLLQKD